MAEPAVDNRIATSRRRRSPRMPRGRQSTENPPGAGDDSTTMRIEFKRIALNKVTQREIKTHAAARDISIPSAYGELLLLGLKHKKELYKNGQSTE